VSIVNLATVNMAYKHVTARGRFFFSSKIRVEFKCPHVIAHHNCD